MRVDIGKHRTDYGKVMGDPGGAGQGFTKLHAGHRGGDRPEIAADIHWGIRLGIKGLVLRWPAAQEKNDTGFGPAKTDPLGNPSSLGLGL